MQYNADCLERVNCRGTLRLRQHAAYCFIIRVSPRGASGDAGSCLNPTNVLFFIENYTNRAWHHLFHIMTHRLLREANETTDADAANPKLPAASRLRAITH